MSALLVLPLAAPVPTMSKCAGGLAGQFFVRFDASIVNTFGGGVNIWNSTGFVASDAKTSRLRLDSQSELRSLSSGPSFKTESRRLFVANATARSVSSNACTSSGSPAFPFPAASACVGSIARFMPLGALDYWANATDSWLGYDTLDGVNVSVWGWTKSDPGRPASSMHRVYLEASADPGVGRPLMEEQGHSLAESYPTRARVRFSAFETILGSDFIFSAPGIDLFAPPMPCHFESAAWDPTTGKPPYDDTAYKCESAGFKVVKATMHTTTDLNAFYTWPTLPAKPPKAVVTQVPHEGGPGPEIVCYAEKL